MLTLAGSSRAAQAAQGRGRDAGTPVSPWPTCGGDRLPFPALGQTQVLTAAFREGLLSLCTAPPYTAASFCSFSAALASPLGSNWVLRGLTSLFFPLDGPKHVLCLLPPRQPPLVLWWHAPSWSHSLPYPHPCADERSCKQQRSLAGENLQMSLKLELNINQLINMGRCQGCLHHEWAN